MAKFNVDNIDMKKILAVLGARPKIVAQLVADLTE
jgi:hypothetical protein